jgi:hypothetical protein
MESKLTQVQQLPPPPKPPILLEIEQARQEIQELRQEIREIKTAIGTSANLIRLTAAPKAQEITQALQPSLEATRKVLQSDIQKIVHAELKAALQHSKKWIDALSKQIDDLPKKIAEAIPQKKKSLSG